jgi:hypothetical protein
LVTTTLAKPNPLDKDQVLKDIRDALGPKGRIFPSRHITRDSMPKRNFDVNDVINVLEKAATVKPVWNTNTDTWNYAIRGEDLDGNDLTIRIAPTDDQTGIVLVTGF